MAGTHKPAVIYDLLGMPAGSIGCTAPWPPFWDSLVHGIDLQGSGKSPPLVQTRIFKFTAHRPSLQLSKSALVEKMRRVHVPGKSNLRFDVSFVANPRPHGCSSLFIVGIGQARGN